MRRLKDVIRFYSILGVLEHRIGGTRTLNQGRTGVDWPKRGVYFFFELGEDRSDSGKGPRVVRVGTHAVSSGSKTTIWKRLRTHRGSLRTGGGNHRASIFRGRVGEALANMKPQLRRETWRQGGSAPPAVRQAEHELEEAVSREIRSMPFLWLQADDPPSKDSIRCYLERNSIALLSNFGRIPVIDPPGPSWLGRRATVREIRESGLWNSDYVDEEYEETFLDVLESKVREL